MRLREVATSECRREELSRRGMAEMVHLQCTSALPSLPPLVDESLHTPARRGSNKSSLLSSIVRCTLPELFNIAVGRLKLAFASHRSLLFTSVLRSTLPSQLRRHKSTRQTWTSSHSNKQTSEAWSNSGPCSNRSGDPSGPRRRPRPSRTSRPWPTAAAAGRASR